MPTNDGIGKRTNLYWSFVVNLTGTAHRETVNHNKAYDSQLCIGLHHTYGVLTKG